jgi:hypothetical protein
MRENLATACDESEPILAAQVRALAMELDAVLSEPDRAASLANEVIDPEIRRAFDRFAQAWRVLRAQLAASSGTPATKLRPGRAPASSAGTATLVLSVAHEATVLLERVEAALTAWAAALEADHSGPARRRPFRRGFLAAPSLSSEATRARLGSTLSDATMGTHALWQRLAAGPSPEGLVTTAAFQAVGSTPSPANEVLLTLSTLAALLAVPGDPSGAGTLDQPVQAALAGPLRRLLKSEEAAGWQLSGAIVGDGYMEGNEDPYGSVAQPVAAAATAEASGRGSSPGDGWRLPRRG